VLVNPDFLELRDVYTEKSAWLRQGGLVAAGPDEVGPPGAQISRFREMFGLRHLQQLLRRPRARARGGRSPDLLHLVR
jgi:hypothetical protein